jgi:predicted enzyme related to lactoylglutathione lyase
MVDAPRRDRFPAGVPCWVDIEPPDPGAAKRFYEGLFGWAFDDAWAPGSPGEYAVARLRDAAIAGLGHVAGRVESAVAWNTYVCVDDVGAASEKVREAGGHVTAGPIEVAGAAAIALCVDPFGASFRLWEPRGHNGVQRANEDGTWNMSDLSTPDLEGARTFYGAVFGWVVDEVDFGGVTGYMVRMPGYGDFLEQFEPGIRERQAEAGVPAGYEDAVAWMSRIGDPPPESPRWGITFAVDDVDAVVARASALGGQAVVPPFDAGPGVRLAVLGDPVGATFTVNRYSPA